MAPNPGYVAPTPPVANPSYINRQSHPDSKAAYNYNSHPPDMGNSHGNAAPRYQNPTQHPTYLTTTNFAAELPSQDAKTPMELDGQYR